jgi:hypothetical protein
VDDFICDSSLSPKFPLKKNNEMRNRLESRASEKSQRNRKVFLVEVGNETIVPL